MWPGASAYSQSGLWQKSNFKLCKAPTHKETSTDIVTVKHKTILLFKKLTLDWIYTQLWLWINDVQQRTLTDPHTPSISGSSIYCPSGWYAQTFSRVSPSSVPYNSMVLNPGKKILRLFAKLRVLIRSEWGQALTVHSSSRAALAGLYVTGQVFALYGDGVKLWESPHGDFITDAKLAHNTGFRYAKFFFK